MKKIKIKIYSTNNYKSDENIAIIFEVNNQSNEDVVVLKRNTPLEGLISDCLLVTINGKIVSYDGLFVKRSKPSKEEFVFLKAGESISSKLDLSSAYNLTEDGIVSVEFKTENLKIYQELRFNKNNLIETESDDNVFAIDGDRVTFRINSMNRQTIGSIYRNEAKKKLRKVKGIDEVRFAGFPDPIITGATATQEQKIIDAHKNGYNLTKQALDSLRNDGVYATWFGVFDNLRFNRVKDNYEAIKSRMESQVFSYVNNGPNCRPDWYAYTTKGSSTIFLCSLFWTTADSGTDSKSGTILHEHSHATASTDDLKYGQADCKILAISDPGSAIKNADNYEYFVGG